MALSTAASAIAGWTDGFAEEIVRPRRYLNWNIFLAGPDQWVRSPSAERRSQMSPLRMLMIEDMKLAGLSPGTQATYIDAVRREPRNPRFL